ncbi:MAG: inovirus Gp2 family protein [Gammaproteobacteria bacterium]|nr:inovirus Gp2 family protein [Gammaproteobacteria bacterium]
MDLRLPRGLQDFKEDRLIDSFISSLRAKVRHARKKSQLTNPKTHDTSVRYAYTREVGQKGVPHYHLVIFVNCSGASVSIRLDKT